MGREKEYQCFLLCVVCGFSGESDERLIILYEDGITEVDGVIYAKLGDAIKEIENKGYGYKIVEITPD